MEDSNTAEMYKSQANLCFDIEQQFGASGLLLVLHYYLEVPQNPICCLRIGSGHYSIFVLLHNRLHILNLQPACQGGAVCKQQEVKEETR